MPASLAADPAVCTASVSTLPNTGGAFPIWLALLAVALVVVGAATLRTLRRSAAVGAGLTVALVAALLAAPSAAPGARAADVDYGAGCALFRVDDIAVAPEAGAMLPGDSVVAVTAVITNRYSGPIRLDGRAELAGAPLAGAVVTSVAFGSGPDPVILPAGGSTPVSVTVRVPSSATDGLQGRDAALTLVLTASAQ